MADVKVTICDVAPRDGLQNDPKILEPAVRADLVDRLAAAGLPRIESVSFVNPARVPQMAGAEEVVAAIERVPGVVYAGLALNDRGYDRLRETGLDEVHFAFAASEEFNRRNQGASVEESLASAERIVSRAREDSIRATVTIGTSFGCPFAPRATGNISTEDLVYMLHGEGIETGMDLDALIGVAEWLSEVLGRELEGQVYKAGTFAPVAG